MKLLRIDSSARKNSVSRQMTETFVSAWRSLCPDSELLTRDLAALSFPLIEDDWVSGARQEPEKRTAAEKKALELSDDLIEELQSANGVVIGAPMYNFTICAPLKAWIDQVVRPGKTVRYGPGGPKGLLGPKRVVVLTSRGGAYAGERSGFDYQEPYLRTVLAFVGLTEVTFIHAEHQLRADKAPEQRKAAMRAIEDFVRSTRWGTAVR